MCVGRVRTATTLREGTAASSGGRQAGQFCGVKELVVALGCGDAACQQQADPTLLTHVLRHARGY